MAYSDLQYGSVSTGRPLKAMSLLPGTFGLAVGRAPVGHAGHRSSPGRSLVTSRRAEIVRKLQESRLPGVVTSKVWEPAGVLSMVNGALIQRFASTSQLPITYLSTVDVKATLVHLLDQLPPHHKPQTRG